MSGCSATIGGKRQNGGDMTTIAIGGMAFTGNLGGAVTVIAAAGAFVPVGNGTPAHPLFVLDPSFAFSIVLDPPASPNECQFQRLRYDGVKALCAAINCAVSVQEPTLGAVGYAGRLTQNGVVIPNSPADAQTGGLVTSADSLSVLGGITMNPGDIIGIEIANLTNTDNLNVSSCHIQVIGLGA